jgi:hypothetical protein
MKNFFKKIFTKKSRLWLKSAAIRATKTFAQTFAAFLTVGAAISEIDWKYAASVSAAAFVASIFTSLAGLPEDTESENTESAVG